MTLPLRVCLVQRPARVVFHRMTRTWLVTTQPCLRLISPPMPICISHRNHILICHSVRPSPPHLPLTNPSITSQKASHMTHRSSSGAHPQRHTCATTLNGRGQLKGTCHLAAPFANVHDTHTRWTMDRAEMQAHSRHRQALAGALLPFPMPRYRVQRIEARGARRPRSSVRLAVCRPSPHDLTPNHGETLHAHGPLLTHPTDAPRHAFPAESLPACGRHPTGVVHLLSIDALSGVVRVCV